MSQRFSAYFVRFRLRVRRAGALAALAAFVTLEVSTGALGFSRSAEAGEAPLVRLHSIDPTIEQDIRYAGSNNFTGRPVPGYEAPSCWLRPAVAKALSSVQADLARLDPPLGLKVFDCYRPRRSVAAFMAWAGEAEDRQARAYHPGLARSSLVPRGYIGRTSLHSRGIAVDLTLVRRVPAASGTRAGASDRPCTQGAGDGDGLDMGTTFDCFDPRSHTDASGLTAAQRGARQTLRRTMEKHGFQNYAREWWHFTYGTADDGRAFDVPVR